MEQQGKAYANGLVMVVFPAQGHINPMIQLATILHSKGFSIIIAHPQFNSPNPSNHPEFTFVPIPDNLVESKIPPGDILATVKVLNSNCRAPFELCMKKMLEEAHLQGQIKGIIYDGFMYFAQTVADQLKLPGISVRTSAAATMIVFAANLRPDKKGYISFQDSTPQDTALELQSLKLKELLDCMKEYPTEAMLELRANITSAMKGSSAIIVNTMYFLEREALTKIQANFAPPIFTVGPFHMLAPTSSSSLLKEDPSCIAWMDRQAPKSVIYVSFGSVASMGEKDLIEVAWGLADSEQPFLWVIRPGLVPGSDLRELLPKSFEERVGDRGCIVEWAPQKEVLAHGAVGGFWTHCGWNSTLESICEGVPMLCRPFFGDQRLNARYVCDMWKIGLEVENDLERGKIEKAVRRMMACEEGEEVRQRAISFKEKAELCLKEGGSTYSSLNDLVELIVST